MLNCASVIISTAVVLSVCVGSIWSDLLFTDNKYVSIAGLFLVGVRGNVGEDATIMQREFQQSDDHSEQVLHHRHHHHHMSLSRDFDSLGYVYGLQ